MSARHRTGHRWAPPAITGALFGGTYLLWKWLTDSGTVHEIVLPRPADVWAAVVDLVGQDSFVQHLQTTATSIVVGFAIGAGSAIVVALACDHFATLKRILTPYMVALQALPKIVLLPLLAVWLGVGYRATTALVVLVVFFPVYLNTLTGLGISDPDGTRLLTSLGATPAQRFRYHRIPSALPLVFTGLKTAVNFAVAAAIAAELLGARYGLGFLIANSGNFFRIDELWAAVVVTTVFAGVFYAAFEVIDRKVVFWRPQERSN